MSCMFPLVEIFSRLPHRFRYTCPIKKKCSMNEGSKPKPMGYKQYAIHAGHEHNMVELAMRRDVRHAKEVAPVLEALAAARLAEVHASFDLCYQYQSLILYNILAC